MLLVSGNSFEDSTVEWTSVLESWIAVYREAFPTRRVAMARLGLTICLGLAICLGFFCFDGVWAQSATVPKPMVVKVVVIASFERGEDVGMHRGSFSCG